MNTMGYQSIALLASTDIGSSDDDLLHFLPLPGPIRAFRIHGSVHDQTTLAAFKTRGLSTLVKRAL